jgi:hypothetical protein
MSVSIRDASLTAVSAVEELFEGQSLSNVLFEEVDKDATGNWLITVGFDRRVDRPGMRLGQAIADARATERKYKVVKIDPDGELLSVKDRLLEP